MVAIYNMHCHIGATFSEVVQWLNPDGSQRSLSDHDAYMQVRSAPGTDLILSFTTADDTITHVGDTLALAQTPAATGALAAGLYNYDLVIVDPSTSVVLPLLKGTFGVSPLITELPS